MTDENGPEKRIARRQPSRAAWLRRASDSLAARHRFYAVGSAALADFKENGLVRHNYYFTVNAFLGVLALFVAVTSLMGFLAETEFRRQLVEGMKSVMPILRGPPTRTLNVFEAYRGVVGIISFAFLLWASTRIFSALESGFAIIWRTKRRRYTHMMLVGLLMVAVIGSLFLVAYLVQSGFNTAWGALLDTRGVGYYLGVSIAKPVTGFLVDFFMFLFIYRVVTGVRPGLKKCAIASALAAALFLGTQYLLNLYFDYIYRVPVIYGTLATGIILILWMQLTGLITFYGAEVVYVLENDDAVRRHRERRLEAASGERG